MQTKITNSQTKIEDTQTKIEDTQMKTTDTQLKTANTLMKANMELSDQSMQTYPSDTLIGDKSKPAHLLKPQTAIKDHSKKPSLEAVSSTDTSFKINQKSLFVKPVSFSFDTVAIAFKNTTLKPTKKSRMTTRVDTTTRKQKHLPDQTIHH